jgi:uncharacterized protein
MSDLPPQLKPHIAVQDAVHGRIWLTELEQRIVNTSVFQRLRHIVQLGLANFVFPTATHSRLAHSLGATHVMGWMLRQPQLQEYFKSREDLIPLLRLAALLHDLGHYPYSHLGEAVYAMIERGALDEYIDSRDLTVFDVVASTGRSHEMASHERLTAEIIRRTDVAEIINAELAPIDGRAASEVLIDIISGTHTDSVCHSLVSSDLDCDRLDYLLRDSAAVGLAYGQVDLAYLIENLRVETHPKYGPMLVVDAHHGFGAVEHYLHARYFHYARFITHKTIGSAEMLLAVAMMELSRLGKLPRNANDIVAMVGDPNFLWFADEYVWSLLSEATVARWASSELKEAGSCLLNRTLLKCAHSHEGLERDRKRVYESVRLDRMFDSPDQRRRVAEEAGVALDRFCYQKRSLRLAGMPARITPRPRGEEEKYDWIETVNVADPGGEPEPAVLRPGLLEQLSINRWVTRRVFVREPSFSASDKTKGRQDTTRLEEYIKSELAR